MTMRRRVERAVKTAAYRVGQAPARLAEASRDAVFRSWLYGLSLRGRTPKTLSPLSMPIPFETDGDAETLKSGYLLVGARRVPFGPTGWAQLPDDEDILGEAHRFGWLALLSADDQADRERAAAYLSGWLDTQDRWHAVGWRADVLADRLAAWAQWLGQAPDPGHEELRCRLLTSYRAQTRHLLRIGGTVQPMTWRAFLLCRGLIVTGLSLPGDEALLNTGLRRLEAEIARQVLPDGGHIQRCPLLHMKVLGLLTDMRDLLIAAMRRGDRPTRIEVPHSLQKAVDRMAPMLRLFRLGDGALTLANGGYESDQHAVEAVLKAADAQGRALLNAPHAGFQRIEAGDTVIVVDTGTPPPPGAQASAHGGPLAFELSTGAHRLVVNCGAPRFHNNQWSDAMKSTAAHSTVVIDDRNAVEFLPLGRIGQAPREVLCQRRESDDGATWLDTQHDGYLSDLETVHQRRFYLAKDGQDVRGEDVLRGCGGKTFRIRFHLHPDVRASLVRDGKGALLRLSDGTGWQFSADGGTVSLESSIYLGDGLRPKRCEQVVVSGLLDAAETAVKWRLATV